VILLIRFGTSARRNGVTVHEESSAKVGDILPRVLEIMGLEDKFEEAKLVKGWEAVVGAVVASKSRPRTMREGILYIEVENSVWMQELWYRQKQIIERIAKEFPKVRVTGIRLEIERENS
jgi:predicted nucleic acid-binding Zn ribbon protein